MLGPECECIVCHRARSIRGGEQADRLDRRIRRSFQAVAVLAVVAFAAVNACEAAPPKLAWYWHLVPGWLRPGGEIPQPKIIDLFPIEISDPG